MKVPWILIKGIFNADFLMTAFLFGKSASLFRQGLNYSSAIRVVIIEMSENPTVQLHILLGPLFQTFRA